MQATAVVLYDETILASIAKYIDAGGEDANHAVQNRAFRKNIDFYSYLSLEILLGSPHRRDEVSEKGII